METRTVIRCLNELFITFGLPSYIYSDWGKCFTSQEFISDLNKREVSTSYTSAYSPQGNGQRKRYNAIIWTAVKLSLKTRKLSIEQWQVVLPDTLHSIQSLLCTATNTTLHERLFNFKLSLLSRFVHPNLVSLPGNILLKRHVRTSKHKPLADEVELIHATPNYARVRLSNGHEKNCHIARYRTKVKKSIMLMTTSKANVQQATKLKFKTNQKKIYYLRLPLKINRIMITYKLREKILKMNQNYADLLAIGGHRIA